jgi:hypothetical protein
MQTVIQGCVGLSVLIRVDADRLFMLCVVVAGLLAGALFALVPVQVFGPRPLMPIIG